MKNSLLICSCFFLIFCGLIQVTPTYALSISFEPESPVVNLVNLFEVNVVVSGLDAAREIMSTYELDVRYDPEFLLGTYGQFRLGLDNPLSFETLNDLNFFDTAGVVDFAQLSFLPDAELIKIQDVSLTPSNISFEVITYGTSLLTFEADPKFRIDDKGRNGEILLFDDVGFDSVAPIPEPAAMLLLGVGLIGLAKFSRKKIKK